ncbi:hypothetical protein E0H66_36290 [Rhizobium leguminosarum bv. viciae]|nr:hypothetical protein E0H66_36290 [Rhizobium leguminosarum bv. viciae]
MARLTDAGGLPLHESLPVGWQEFFNPRLTRRALRGGLIASPAAFYSSVGTAGDRASWYDLELMISDGGEGTVAALEQKAVTEIERASVDAQTQLAIAGLSSEAALAFIANLPTVESLMPELSYQAPAG